MKKQQPCLGVRRDWQHCMDQIFAEVDTLHAGEISIPDMVKIIRALNELASEAEKLYNAFDV